MSRRLAVLLALIAVLSAMVLPLSPALAQGAEPVVITWFIGLGAGGQPEQLEAQNAVVEAFNAAHDDIELQIIVVDMIPIDTLTL